MTLSPIVADAWRMASWGWDVPARVRWIEQCVALGVTSFDHADIYGGRVRPSHRIKSYDSARAHVTASVENSLRALHTDRVDLLLLHRPDAQMDPDELADTFHALRAAGKVREFGVSNHAPSQFAMLHRRLALATHQIELSPLHLDAHGDGTLDQCMDLRVRPMIRSPLAGGQLFTAGDERALRVRAALDELGQAHGVGAATVAYAWILRHPSRSLPIAGSSRIAAIAEAVAALALRLDAEEWYRVWSAITGHEVA